MTDITDDPFANVEETGSEKADTPAPTEAAPADFDFASFLAQMTIDDEDFEAPAPVVDRYVRPAENSWIPVRVVSVDTTQHDMKAVVATLPDGPFVTIPQQIDMAVEKGMTQSVENVTLWQFVVEAEHVATCYGERSNAYRLYTPAFPMRIPLRQPRNRNGVQEIGFDKNSGKRLLAATRVVKPGQRLTEDEEALRALGDAMTADGGAIVMAKVRYRVKKSEEAIPRKKADGTFLKARIDETSGSFVKLTKKEDGQYVYAETGEPYTESTTSLIPVDGAFLIPDDSDDGMRVQDLVKREATYDNLSDDVAVVPGRQIEVQRQDGSTVSAEITWETVGMITVQPVRPGTLIQAVTEDKEIITASWLGTHWEDVGPHVLTVPSEGPNMGKVVLSPVGQMESGAEVKGSGLDTFKGDSAV